MTKALKIAVLVLLMVGGFLGTFIFGYTSSESSKNKIVEVTPSPVQLSSEKTTELVNEWRESVGKAKYKIDNKLCDFAKIRMYEIKKDWSHDNFLPAAHEFFGSYGYKDLGENLGRDYHTESGLLNGWLNSPSHRKVLDGDYKYTCIIIDGNFAVQIFANYFNK